jgi:hypothetical protein
MTISSTKLDMPPGGEYDGTFLRQWLMTAGEEGAAVSLPRHSDRSIQIAGPFDASTVTIEGTLDGIEWGPLVDQSDNKLQFSSYPSGDTTIIEAISQAVVSVRPKTTGGGAGTALRITLLSRS